MKSKKLTLLLATGLLTVALTGCSLQEIKAWVRDNVVNKARDIISPEQKEEEKKEEQKPSGEDQKPDEGGDHSGEGEGEQEQQVFYTISFVNYDDTVLQSGQVEKGQLPVYEGETPTKAADAQYSYSFVGWDKEIVEATADATYKATFAETVNEYLVKFLDEDGTELQSSNVAYGAMPAYAGEEPTKESTVQYEYSFAGWTPALAEVTGEATYTATYNETVRQYTVKFLDEDGTELQSESLAYGAMPEFKGETPTKESSVSEVFTFAGWDKTIVEVTGEATYTATYSSVAREYTIKFVNEGGAELQSEQLAYGTMPEYKGETPTKAADEHYTYEFAGWNESIVSVAGDKTYTATFNAVMIPLDVNQAYDFTAWTFGAGENNLTDNSNIDWIMTKEAHKLGYKTYDNAKDFELVLPRIDFSTNTQVSMDLHCSNYHGRVCFGLDANDITHKDGIESDRDITGTLMFAYDQGQLIEQLAFGTIVVNNVIDDSDIIHGRKSASVFIKSLWDRWFYLENITFGGENFVVPTFDLTDNKAGAYEKNGESDVTWIMGSNRTVGDVTYTSDADHLMYAIYDMNTFTCGLPKLNFALFKSMTMDLYAPGWNSGAKVGLLADDVNYTSGSGDSNVNGQLAFVYTGGRLLGILDFGTTHKVFDVTDNDVIYGNANPVLYATAYYNRQILVSNIQVHADSEFAMTHDWTVDKLGAAMYKDGSDVTWGFGTYTTSSVLGYKVWDTSMFKFVMPKINYSMLKKATFVFHSTVWQSGVKFGLDENDVNYSTSLGAEGGNISSLDGTLVVVNNGESLALTLTLGDTSVSINVVDADIMNGNAGANMFVKALYDRNLMLNEIKLAF